MIHEHVFQKQNGLLRETFVACYPYVICREKGVLGTQEYMVAQSLELIIIMKSLRR